MNLSTNPRLSGASLVMDPITLKAGLVRWEIRNRRTLELIRELTQCPDDFLASRENLIHESHIVMIARVSLSGDPDARLLLRRMSYAKSAARIRDFFRVAGSLRAFHTALAMERACVPTPRAIAAGIIREWNIPQAGYFLMEEIQSGRTLAEHAQQAGIVPRFALQRIGEAIALMHEKGFFHGDLTINNILLDMNWMPWFIDLERTRKSASCVGWRRSVDDFHRLARHIWKFKTCAQRSSLRVMRYYCAARGWSGREREFVESVFRRLKRKTSADQMTHIIGSVEDTGQ